VRGSPKTPREPIFNVPGVILAMLTVLSLVHGGRLLLSDEDDSWLTLALAFIPARYGAALDQLPGGWASAFFSPLTHMLVHADFTHLGLNAAWLLVFGAIVARRLGSWRLVVFTVLTGLAGALGFGLLHWGALLPMVGASGAVSGLMGGAIRLLHAILRAGAARELAVAVPYVPLASVAETMRDRQVLVIVGVTLVTNLALGATGSILTPGSGGIAWEAHLAGFAAGLLGFGLIDPGPRPLPELPELEIADAAEPAAQDLTK
jgi:membrane associated rhomboid family serine protease